MNASVTIISRFCPTCDAQIKLWKMDRIDGKLVETCADCGNGGLTEHREEVESTT